METIEYIKKYNRLQISSYLKFQIVIINIILFSIFIAFLSLAENYLETISIVIIFFIIFTISQFIIYNLITNLISFEIIYFNEKLNIKDILESLSSEFDLKFIEFNNEVYFTNYFIKRFGVENVKRNLYIIAFHDRILLNISNDNETILYNINDYKKKLIIQKLSTYSIKKSEIKIVQNDN